MLRNRYNEIDVVKGMDLGLINDDNYDESNGWDQCQIYVVDELTDEDIVELINEVDFGLITEGKTYRLEDGQGSNLGDIESEEFESLGEIIDRLSSYWSDYEICILSRDDFELIRRENKPKDKGICGRCGRPLRSKESIARGYGSHCYKKVQEDKAKKEAEENAPIIEPHSYAKLTPGNIISEDKYLRNTETGRIIHQDWVQLKGNKVISSDEEFPAERFEMIKGRDLIAELKKIA